MCVCVKKNDRLPGGIFSNGGGGLDVGWWVEKGVLAINSAAAAALQVFPN